MAAFEDVLNALYDLLEGNTTFKNHVSKHDFSKISDTGDAAIVLRVGPFTVEDEGFGGVYAVAWDVFADIYVRYSYHIEEDVTSLIQYRDILVDLIQQKIYLGKGAGNAQGIEFASVIGGDTLAVVLGEDDTITHITQSVQIRVRQQRAVTLET